MEDKNLSNKENNNNISNYQTKYQQPNINIINYNKT